MPEIVIAGGAGFIGTALINELGATNIRVFDNLSSTVHTPQSISDFLSLGVDLITGDISLKDDVSTLLDTTTPDVLVYLIAETGTGRSLYNIELNTRINILGLSVLLDEMARREKFPKRIILTSSRAVYGEGPYVTEDTGSLVYPDQREKKRLEAGEFDYQNLSPLPMCADEHLPKPISVYGSTKLAQENLILNWARSFEIPYYIFRLQNVYGGGQSLSNPYTGVLIHFLNQVAKGDDVLVYENGGITRDFIHVQDIARALKCAINGEGKPGIYDVGTGMRTDLFDVAATLSTIAGGKEPKLCNLFRLGDVRHACANIEAMESVFSWKPKITLTEGLKEVNDFYDRKTKPKLRKTA